MTSYDLGFEEIIEIRSGRHLNVRHCSISGSSGIQTAEKQSLVLFCVHGTAANHEQYLPILKELQCKCQALNCSVDCYLWDAIGCGKSPTLADSAAYTDDENVKDLAALIQRYLQDNQKLIFIGHSYGPTWIFKYLLSQKQGASRVKGLILLSSGLANQKFQLQKGGPSIFKMPLWLLRCLQPLLTQSFLKMGFSQHTHRENFNLVANAKVANNQNDMATVCKYYVNHDWLHDLSSVKHVYEGQPPLILHGVDDKILPIEAGQELANEWNVKLTSVSETSHMLMLEDPTVVADHVFSYLEKFL